MIYSCSVIKTKELIATKMTPNVILSSYSGGGEKPSPVARKTEDKPRTALSTETMGRRLSWSILQKAQTEPF